MCMIYSEAATESLKQQRRVRVYKVLRIRRMEHGRYALASPHQDTVWHAGLNEAEVDAFGVENMVDGDSVSKVGFHVFCNEQSAKNYRVSGEVVLGLWALARDLVAAGWQDGCPTASYRRLNISRRQYREAVQQLGVWDKVMIY